MPAPSRREFLATAGVAAASLAASSPGFAQSPAGQVTPPLAQSTPGQPVVCGSLNAAAACPTVVELLRQGIEPLDAVVAGVNIVEDDPADHSVGLGGLPNEDGVVELDASVMDGRTHRAGAVAALQNIKNPSSVARLVARYTDHVLLVGDGALRFARRMGFQEENLLTAEAREIWLKWKATHSDDDDWLWPDTQPTSAAAARAKRRVEHTYGTINCLALRADGALAGCTSTSGLSYKLPGRVGDSPIIGAGLYVDNEIGAAGSTGRGEANLQNCSSFLVVELMGRGMSPTDACLEVLRRIVRHTESRLRNTRGEPDFNLLLYALRRDGAVGGAALRSGRERQRMAMHDGTAGRTLQLPSLFED